MDEKEALHLFEQYLVWRLDNLQTEKSKSKVVPNMVTKSELFSAIETDKKAILNSLFKQKRIRVHKTIHAPIQDFVELIKESTDEPLV